MKGRYGWLLKTEDVAAFVSELSKAEATDYVARVAASWGLDMEFGADPYAQESIAGMTHSDCFMAGCITGVRFLSALIVGDPDDANLAKIVAKIGAKQRADP